MENLIEELARSRKREKKVIPPKSSAALNPFSLGTSQSPCLLILVEKVVEIHEQINGF